MRLPQTGHSGLPQQLLLGPVVHCARQKGRLWALCVDQRGVGWRTDRIGGDLRDSRGRLLCDVGTSSHAFCKERGRHGSTDHRIDQPPPRA